MAETQGHQTRQRLMIVFATVLVAAGLITWAWTWPAPRPQCNALEFVATANFSHFDLSNNTLRYNFTVNVTTRNPNQRIGVYYDHVEARAYYHGQRLDAVNLTTSYQPPETTTVAAAAFHGQRRLVLLGQGFDEFGVYEVEVRLYLSVRFRLLGKSEMSSGVFDYQLCFPLHLRIGASSPSASYDYIDVDQMLIRT